MENNKTEPATSIPPQPVQNITSPHTPVWLIIILLIFFWPAAFYLIYKDKYYHVWFPILLWIYTIPFLLLSFSYAFFVFPQLNALYATMNVIHPSLTIIYAIFIFVDIVLVGEIIFAFYAKKKIKEQTTLAKKVLIITLILLVLNGMLSYINGVFLATSVVTPIYSLISEVGTPVQLPPSTSPTSSSASILHQDNSSFNLQDFVLVYDTEDRITKNNMEIDNDKVMLQYGLNSSPVVVGYPKYSDSFSYSSALQKIAYINNPSNSSNAFKENGVYIYDIKTKNTDAIKETLGNIGFTYLKWSPSGKYLITYDNPLAVPGGGVIYSYPDGKKISISTAIDIFNVGWINSDDLAVVKPTYRAAGDCTGEATASIDTIALPSGTEKSLVNLNGSVASGILTVDKGIVYYVITPLDPDGCEGNTSTYWRINSDGTNKMEVSQTDIPNENKSNISDIIKQAVLQAVASHKIAEADNPANVTPNEGYLPINIITNSKDPNWVAFELKDLNYENSPSNPVYILNLNNPQQTFKMVTNGLSPSW